MKWVTRKRIHVNRTATGWLIRRFLDPSAEIVFVEPGEVAGVQERDGAIGFDAPGARHPHADAQGRCSFEQLVAERLAGDTALARLALIVHGADFPEKIGATPESAGLWAISQGFTDVGRRRCGHSRPRRIPLRFPLRSLTPTKRFERVVEIPAPSRPPGARTRPWSGGPRAPRGPPRRAGTRASAGPGRRRRRRAADPSRRSARRARVERRGPHRGPRPAGAEARRADALPHGSPHPRRQRQPLLRDHVHRSRSEPHRRPHDAARRQHARRRHDLDRARHVSRPPHRIPLRGQRGRRPARRSHFGPQRGHRLARLGRDLGRGDATDRDGMDRGSRPAGADDPFQSHERPLGLQRPAVRRAGARDAAMDRDDARREPARHAPRGEPGRRRMPRPGLGPDRVALRCWAGTRRTTSPETASRRARPASMSATT